MNKPYNWTTKTFYLKTWTDL